MDWARVRRGSARVLVWLVLFASACPKVSPLAFAQDTTGIFRLHGRYARAHACPVVFRGELYVLTNAHVTALWNRWDLYPYRYSNGAGEEGVIDPLRVDRASDLAVVKPSSMPTHWYRVAEQAPKVGDKVRLIGFDTRNHKTAYAEKVFDTTVARVVAGHLILSDAGTRGSSGSCVLNERGEVVAVNARGEPMENGREVGGVVGVWGEWLDRLREDK